MGISYCSQPSAAFDGTLRWNPPLSDTFQRKDLTVTFADLELCDNSSGAASALLDVVWTHNAGDVMEFTAAKRAQQRENARAFARGEEAKEHRPPSSAIVVDSKMTPLEAATLLWENNIMGAPVYDADAKTYVGMFDTRDILSCVTAAHREFLAMGGQHNPGGDDALPELPHAVGVIM